jgi:hypothetical protein
MYRHPIRTMFVLAAMLAALVLSSAPAAARTTPFSFTYDDTTIESPCGFPMEVHNVGKAMGRVFFDADGNFVKIELTNAGVVTLTNPANGLSATSRYQTLFKNFNQVDNGDGTLTLDQTTVGASSLYGPNGELLLRTHGPMTVHLTINPEASDPADFIVSLEVVSEHGSHPDDEAQCQALTAAIGVTI